MKVRVTFLYLLTSLCLLSSLSPARAQFGPPGGGGSGGGGHGGPPQWVITSECNGAATVTDWPEPTTTIISRQGGSSIGASGYLGQGPFPTATCTYINIIQFHLRWLNSDGTPGPNPPKTVYLRETSGIHWSGSGQHAGANATAVDDDGIGDFETLYTTQNPLWFMGMCGGNHLIQKDGSTGKIDISITQSSVVTATDGPLTDPNDTPSSSCSVYWGCGILLDTRGVSISSSLDATYHCSHEDGADFHRPVLNVMDDAGTMRGDTLGYDPTYLLNDVLGINYTANVMGQWSDGSEYHWFSSKTLWFKAGAFSGSSVPDFDVRYSEPQDIEHVFIHLIDSAGVDAKSNYYMHFHRLYEPVAWPDDPYYPKKVMGPDPEMPDWPTYLWMAGATNGSVSILVGPQGAGAGFSRNITTGTSHSVDGGLDIGKGPVNVHFGGGYDWSAGQETSVNLVLRCHA